MYRFRLLFLGLLILGWSAPSQAQLMLSGLTSPSAIASNSQGAPFFAKAGGRVVQLLEHNLASPLGSVDDEISSLAFDVEGSLYATGAKAIWKVSTSGQAVPVLKGMAACGITVAPDGAIYFIAAQPPGVYRLAGGKAVKLSGAVPQPSAVVASSDALLVASRDGKIWKLGLSGGRPLAFAKLRGEGRPAAMVRDESGDVYIARDGGGEVSFLTPAGQPDDGYPIPGPRVTGLAFGGVELQDLYVTEAQSGAVYKVHVAQRAARLPWEPDKALRITEPVDGAILNRHDGDVIASGLRIAVKGTTRGAGPVRINGTPVAVKDGQFVTALTLKERETRIVAEGPGGRRDEVVVLWDRDSFPRYRFSTDDNIWFLRDIARHADTYRSIFENPYLAFWREMHEKYGTKVHFNIYYEMEGFNLSQMPDKYRPEWQANANWIHLSMHARANDPDRPYIHASGEQIGEDYRLVNREIERFAGKELTTSEATVHWGEAPREAIRALRQEGVKVLPAYFISNEDGLAWVSMYLPLQQWRYMTGHDYWKDRQVDVTFIRHDIVINLVPLPQIVPYLERIAEDPHQSEVMELMIHEPHFYPEFRGYEADYRQRVETALRWVTEKGYKPVFYSDGFLGTGKP